MSEADYRPEFLAALDLLARVSQDLRRAGKPVPILVGGAVVEFDTMSAITSGDFDLVATDEDALAEALAAAGFLREDRPGHRRGGWYHPDLSIAVDCVSNRYYDGRGDRARLRTINMEGGDIVMAPTEEIIADRIGQWLASDRRETAMAEQIALLFALAGPLDEAYLQRRVTEDNGESVSFDHFKPRAP